VDLILWTERGDIPTKEKTRKSEETEGLVSTEILMKILLIAQLP